MLYGTSTYKKLLPQLDRRWGRGEFCFKKGFFLIMLDEVLKRCK